MTYLNVYNLPSFYCLLSINSHKYLLNIVLYHMREVTARFIVRHELAKSIPLLSPIL